MMANSRAGDKSGTAYPMTWRKQFEAAASIANDRDAGLVDRCEWGRDQGRREHVIRRNPWNWWLEIILP